MPQRLLRISWWRRHANLLVVTLAVVLVVGGVIDNAISNRDLARNAHVQSKRTAELAQSLKRAICTLRQERITNIADSRRFLRNHPQGIDGISRADIQRSIQQQQETVRAFRFADC